MLCYMLCYVTRSVVRVSVCCAHQSPELCKTAEPIEKLLGGGGGLARAQETLYLTQDRIRQTEKRKRASIVYITALRRIQKCLTGDDAKTVADGLAGSQLDNCNSHFGISVGNINTLQPLQDTLSRVPTGVIT